MTKEDIALTLSRVGNKSIVFGVGDSWQADVKNAGFTHIFNMLNDEQSRQHGIHCFKLQEEIDIMRSPLVRYIMTKMRADNKKCDYEPSKRN
jgi:hypothetical protein